MTTIRLDASVLPHTFAAYSKSDQTCGLLEAMDFGVKCEESKEDYDRLDTTSLLSLTLT